jgi:catechol 2,3-dioxygenase-like lactoylglutathione lyase family enzyme
VDRPHAPGLRHLAFTVSDIEALVAKLRERGVRFFSEVQTVPSAQVTYANDVRKRLVYFQDPEGNLLELCEYR